MGVDPRQAVKTVFSIHAYIIARMHKPPTYTPTPPHPHLLLHKPLGPDELVFEPGTAIPEGKGAHHAVPIKRVARAALVRNLEVERVRGAHG